MTSVPQLLIAPPSGASHLRSECRGSGDMSGSGVCGRSDCRVPVTLPPYALSAPVFRFRNLAALAGRAPIGGAREVALACFVAARLVSDCCDPTLELDEELRAARCAGAKGWLGTIAIPSPVRTPVAKLAEASALANPAVMAPLVSSLARAAESFLDAASRSELDVLAAKLAAMKPPALVSREPLVASG